MRKWIATVAMSAAMVTSTAARAGEDCSGDVTVDDSKSTTCTVIGGKLIIRGTRTPNLDSVTEIKGELDLMLRPVSLGNGIQSNAASPSSLKLPNLKRADSVLITWAGVSSISMPKLESVNWIWFHGLRLKSVEPFAKLTKAGRIQVIDTFGADNAFSALTEAESLEYSNKFTIKPSLPKLVTITDELDISNVDGGNFPLLSSVNTLDASYTNKLYAPLLKKVTHATLNTGELSSSTTVGPTGAESIQEVTGTLEVRNAAWLSKKDKGLFSLRRVGTLALNGSSCGMPNDQIRAMSIGLLKVDIRGTCWKLLGPSLRKQAKRVVHYDPNAWQAR